MRDVQAMSGSCRHCSASGTPVWDFGARGTLVGLTRGSGRAEIVRAVLEGVAHRGADLVEASESDSGFPIAALRIDGGMSDNDVFVQALADAIGRPVEISPVQEATTLGAGLLAGLAVGTYATTSELAETFSPRAHGRAAATATPIVLPHATAGWRRGRRPKAPSRNSRASPSEGVSPAPEGDLAARVTPFPANHSSCCGTTACCTWLERVRPERSCLLATYAPGRTIVRAEWP